MFLGSSNEPWRDYLSCNDGYSECRVLKRNRAKRDCVWFTSMTSSLVDCWASSRIPLTNCLLAALYAFPASIIPIHSFTNYKEESTVCGENRRKRKEDWEITTQPRDKMLYQFCDLMAEGNIFPFWLIGSKNNSRLCKHTNRPWPLSIPSHREMT